jgi:hypothetical protein
MATIPTTEPAQVTAGDTLRWRREDLSDYPANDAWVLTYELRAAGGAYTITASADGAAHAVTVAAATSAAYAAGTYTIGGYVAKAGQRFEVYRGTLVILPNLAASGVADRRSHVRKVLDAIEAVLEGRATRDQEQVTFSDGRSLRYMPVADLLMLREKYRAELAREDAAAAIAAGRSPKNRIFVRFTG